MSGELAVQSILTADATFKGLAGSGVRVFYDEVDQTTALPFSIVSCDNIKPNDTQTGVSTLDFDSIYVTHFHSTKKALNALAVAARNALDRVSGTYNGVIVESIQFVTQKSGSEYLVDKKTFTIEQQYQVMTK